MTPSKNQLYKILFIILLSFTFSFGSNFVKINDYILDKEHNLFWQDTQENITILKTQVEAISYCDNLNLSGYSDWKLPTREQYKYIIDKTRKDELMINRRFEYILSNDYWSIDTTWRSFGRYGYYIFFKSGAIYYQNKTYPKYVRCVREK